MAPETTLHVEYLRIPQVAAILPRNDDGSMVSKRSIERWIFIGLKGVRLKALKIGHHWMVKKEDLDTFGEQVAARSIGTAPTQAKNMPTKLSEATKKRLIAAGLMKSPANVAVPS